MHLAALVARPLEVPLDRCHQTAVFVTGHQLYPRETSGFQPPELLLVGCLALGVGDIDGQDLPFAILAHAADDQDSLAGHPPLIADVFGVVGGPAGTPTAHHSHRIDETGSAGRIDVTPGRNHADHIRTVPAIQDPGRCLFDRVPRMAVPMHGLTITPEGIRATEVTPDEKSVVVRRAGRFYLYPIDGGEPRPIAAAEDGERALRWSPDGKYLFLQRVAADGRSLQFIRVNILTGAKQVWKEAGPADPIGVAIVNSAITPDGSAYAYSYSRDLSNLYLLKGVK